MNKRLVFATLLSFIVLLAFSALLEVVWPSSNLPSGSVEKSSSSEDFQEKNKQSQEELSSSSSFVPPTTLLLPSNAEEIPFNTELFSGTFLSSGARLLHLSLHHFFEEAYSDKKIPVLFEESLQPSSWNSFHELPFSFSISEDNASNFIFEQRFSRNSSEYFIRKMYTFSSQTYLFRIHVEHNMPSDVEWVWNIEPQITAHDRNDLLSWSTLSDSSLSYQTLGNADSIHHAQGVLTSSKYWAVLGFPSGEHSRRVELLPPQEEKNKSSWSWTFSSLPSSFDLFIYAGPKELSYFESLENKEMNDFSFSFPGLGRLVAPRSWLYFVEWPLKRLLDLFYALSSNWGIAIILLTVVVKILLYPTARKAFEATRAMQNLTPEIKELQEKYKNDQVLLQQKLSELYRSRGVNPAGGCLPLLLQLPIFLTLYGLFNNSFDLRGAGFIPYWIDDLSRPESIYYFGNFFTLPFLDWTDVRLLPFIMLLSQFLTMWSSGTVITSSQQKWMIYGFPIFFFFILYDMPSGLILYWTMNNVLTALQQFLIKNYSMKEEK